MWKQWWTACPDSKHQWKLKPEHQCCLHLKLAAKNGSGTDANKDKANVAKLDSEKEISFGYG
jgi:hypothetical protein